MQEIKSSHPWLTDEIIQLTEQKRRAEGTPQESEAVIACSAKIMEERMKHMERMKVFLQEMKSSSKLWWKKKMVKQSVNQLKFVISRR